jgi:hypothetical protein
MLIITQVIQRRQFMTNIPTIDAKSIVQVKWFYDNEVTLVKRKTKYLFGAEQYLYFRKGEDWLKLIISFFIALARGEELIRNLAESCQGPQREDVLKYTDDNMEDLKNLKQIICIDWLHLLSQYTVPDEYEKCQEYIKTNVWNDFIAWKDMGNIPTDFKILCRHNNKIFLPHWQAVGTNVKFYLNDEDAGSHRFYVNEKGYAIFWRQKINGENCFYGFEGTDSKGIQLLKEIFETEWVRALP